VRRSRRRGFTLIELLIVLIIVAILAGLGLLKYIDLRATARTTSLAGDIRAVHVGALAYYADKDDWPPDVGAGAVPTGLGPYMPGGLAASFDRTFYVLDFQNTNVGGSPLITVAVTSSDTKLMAKLVSTFGTRTPFYMSGGTLTYVISAP
jgi:prepilin-type N-terminal cleavage/methylation domain-containing protein